VRLKTETAAGLFVKPQMQWPRTMPRFAQSSHCPAWFLGLCYFGKLTAAGALENRSTMPASAHPPDGPFQLGESFTKEFIFDRDGIVAFAAMAGDMNPMHHDEAIAQASRFKGLIASGTQTSSVMLGAMATYVSARAPALGLEFSVRLKKAVRAGDKTTITWTVTRIEWRASLGGEIVVFEGTLRNQDGAVAATAEAYNLVFRPGALNHQGVLP
jgi:acyl dehydratase